VAFHFYAIAMLSLRRPAPRGLSWRGGACVTISQKLILSSFHPDGKIFAESSI
jgi:hypothetical protein